jgi:flotillin
VELAGEAEARIVLVKGQAVAEALGMKAEAYQRFNQAAVLAAILEAMPAIVSAAAEPMSNIDSLTVLSTRARPMSSRRRPRLSPRPTQPSELTGMTLRR